MKDEIKEINNRICQNCKYHYIEEISFDYPQSCCNKTNPNHTTEKWLNCDNFEYSDDYITNLQESEAYYYGQYIDYKSRNKKAIEFINSTGYGTDFSMSEEEVDKVFNILGGDDNGIMDKKSKE